jgi:hypothetical protein
LDPLAGRVFEVPGLVVKADSSKSRGCGFEPDTVYWMDVRYAS